jgi:hypothetical protein
MADRTANLSATLQGATLASICAAAIAGTGNQSTGPASCAASLTNAIASNLAAELQRAGISATATNAIAGNLNQTCQVCSSLGTITVASVANLAKALGLATLDGTADVASVAILVQTLGGATLSALLGSFTFGPFRVVRSQVTITGATLIQVVAGGGEIVEVTIPGAGSSSQSIAENLHDPV